MNFRHLDNEVDSGNTKTADDGKREDQVGIVDHVPLMSCFTHTKCFFKGNPRRKFAYLSVKLSGLKMC